MTEEKFIKDAAYAAVMSRRFLTILGVWQLDNAGKLSWRHLLANLLTIIYCFVIGIRLIPLGLYIIFDARGTFSLLNLMFRFIYALMVAMKYIILRYQRRNIEMCMKHVEYDWLRINDLSSRKIMMDYARYGNLVIKICAGFTFVSAFLFALLPFFLSLTSKSTLTSDNNGTIILPSRSFSVPSHFGISLASQTPVYEFIYSSQVIATFMLFSVQVACHSLAVVMVMHACGQLNVMAKMVNRLVDVEDRSNRFNSFDSRLSDIISHHVRALRLISFTENMLREIFLVDLGGYTVLLCLCGYLNLLVWKAEVKDFLGIISYLSAFITCMFNIFSFCYIGELLTQECEKIGKITYSIDWHRLSGKQSLDLCLIIAMAQTPMTLTAGGTIQLSYICFASVIKTAIGYLNMLRAVME